MQEFNELTALPPSLLKAVAALDYQSMTAIQAEALPVMLNGQDVLAQAMTGSGKTAAFALSILASLVTEQRNLQSLVLCPTRELADQVSKEIRALARFIPNVKVLSLCGGISIRPQLASLEHEPHIVVGTPGRIQDLLDREALKLDNLNNVVLDEADRMLDMGFLDAVKAILQLTPKARRTWLFSATYPPEIMSISKQFQQSPVLIKVSTQVDASLITQLFYKVDAQRKPQAVLSLLQDQQADSCLVFCNTKIRVRELTDYLWEQKVPAIALQGDMEQREREEALVQFANGSIRIMIATDVAARGLDIKALPLVIAYEIANSTDLHTHRIGRTGRAGEAGIALSLVAPEETPRLARLDTDKNAPLSWSTLPAIKNTKALAPPAMATLVIDAGRQDKLRPGDIVGALTGEGGLDKGQIGKIDVFATRAYVGIARDVIAQLLQNLRSIKIKGKKFRTRKL